MRNPTPPRATPSVTAVGRSHRDGRPVNEDAWYHGNQVLAVADGMGGHPDGEIAAGQVLEVIAALDQQPRLSAASVVGAVVAAHRRIHQPDRPKGQRMGTTVTVVALAGWRAHVAHVGDTRAYMLRAGELTRWTRDHTVAAQQVRADPGGRAKSLLTRSVGVAESVQVDHISYRLRSGDRLLLSTDGLHDHVDDDTIATILRGHPHPAECADALIEQGLRADPQDNVTVLLADVG